MTTLQSWFGPLCSEYMQKVSLLKLHIFPPTNHTFQKLINSAILGV